jgi:hypothetical protein
MIGQNGRGRAIMKAKRLVLSAAALLLLTAVIVGIGIGTVHLLRNRMVRDTRNLIILETMAPGTISTGALRENL